MTLQRATPHKHDIDGEEARLSAIADQALLSMVNDTQAVIHFKIDGTIITANHNFLSTLGFRRSSGGTNKACAFPHLYHAANQCRSACGRASCRSL